MVIWLIYAGQLDEKILPPEMDLQQRDVKLLVKYFKEKDAAGVINVQGVESKEPGILYAFPFCPFATRLLRALNPAIKILSVMEDEALLVVLMKGTA